MTDNLKKFQEEVKTNEELQKKLEAMKDDITIDKLIAAAGEYGITLELDDFAPSEDGELSPEDLEAVTGGGILNILFSRKITCHRCGAVCSGATGYAYHLATTHL